MIDKCQKLNISTSNVSVLFINNMAKFTPTKTSRKNNVYAEPHVIVASGAHPTSIIGSEIPVDSTNASKAGAKLLVKISITKPIPTKATANFNPPSNALENLIPINSAITVSKMNIIGGAPRFINGENILFANSIIELNGLLPRILVTDFLNNFFNFIKYRL